VCTRIRPAYAVLGLGRTRMVAVARSWSLCVAKCVGRDAMPTAENLSIFLAVTTGL
jgi:hypothetical protein